jgi:hypothetical protein
MGDIILTRGTTPIMEPALELTASQAASISKWYLDIRQDDVVKEWHGTGADIVCDNSGVYLHVKATQAETLAFEPGPAEAHIRLVTTDGDADASDMFDVIIGPIIKEGEIT